MKAKTMRRSLFMSVISLLLCMSMLVGTTFAWFTDSVTSANNIIKSGYKVGGIIGYICADTAAGNNVKGNVLTDCTVDGIGDNIFADGKTQYIVGKVVGNYNCNGNCNNNTVTDMTTNASKNIGKIEEGKAVNQ